MFTDNLVVSTLPKIGDSAPGFQASTTHGPIQLSDYKGKWTVLFSHPADFTPVCTTEFIAFAKRYEDFNQRDVQLIALSVDSLSSHLAWVQNIKEKMGIEIPFPVIADLRGYIAEEYGMIHPHSSETVTVRCVFVIDPKQTIRAMIYYPLNVGRNMDEILRLVDALQSADQHACSIPANWSKGDDMVEPPPQDVQEVKRRVETGLTDTDYYLVKRKT